MKREIPANFILIELIPLVSGRRKMYKFSAERKKDDKFEKGKAIFKGYSG